MRGVNLVAGRRMGDDALAEFFGRYVTWALEVRWDIPHAPDHVVALHLPVLQHPDLLRAGVGKQGGMSMLDAVDVGGGTIAVTSPLPAAAGNWRCRTRRTGSSWPAWMS